MDRLHVIAAHDSRCGIGKDGKIPWHLPPDLRRFREITMGHTVVMGRRTWESIGARPLPGRRNLVVSTTIPWAYRRLGAALEAVSGDVYVIGGTKLFSEALRHPKLASVDLTHVYGDFGCDTRIDLSGIAFVGTMILGHETKWRDLTYQTVTYQSGDRSASQAAPRSKEGVS